MNDVKGYLSVETVASIKEGLMKKKAVVEITAKNKVHMERRDYRKMQQGSLKFRSSTEEINPVYGVVQLLDVLRAQIQRVRIMPRDKYDFADIIKTLHDVDFGSSDIVYADNMEIKIIPKKIPDHIL